MPLQLPPQSPSQPISDLWDGFSFWFATIGVVLTFVGGAASIMARRWVRRLARDKEAIVAAGTARTQVEIENATREESEADWWDSFTYWFTTVGVGLAFVGGVASIRARHWARVVASDKEAIVAETQARTNVQIESAKRAAAEANDRAAEANAREAELVKEIEDDKLEQVRIKESLAPRNIDDQGKKNLEAALRRFPNQNVSVAFESFSPETARLASQIAAVLVAAHWNVLYGKAMPFAEDKAIPGLTGIFVRSGVVTDPGKALVDALKRAELTVTGPTAFEYLKGHGDYIFVFVGPKSLSLK